MSKQIIIAEQHRTAAVFSEDQIQELIVATGSYQVSDIYLGSVENVLPGIDAAFVNLGDNERNGFMHVSDLGPLKLKRMAGSITELVAPQQKVLVQVMKEPTGNKGPRLTGKITLPGRYLVLMPYGRGVNLSRRIRSEDERHRLRALGVLVKPPGMGLLIRTEAEGVSEDAIIEDLEALKERWKSIQEEAQTTKAPSLLNRDDDFIQRVLRDVYSADVNRIVADSQSGLQRVKQQLSNWNGGRSPSGVLVDHHRGDAPILDYFRVNAAIREALKPRVDLPSGGYIIIEPTEALTVIDVNSGSFTRSATARETVLWTNCEAAVEIARQLRLRNLAGVIVVDFIDMDSLRDKMHVVEQFERALKADKARPQISQLSDLGLVEMTRKRQGQNIYELFGQPCPACGALGHVVQLPGEQAQPLSVERSSSRDRSSRPAARSEAPTLEPYQNLQALDLLTHPDYQEKSSGRGNRRRRRRGSDAAVPSRVRTGEEGRESAPSEPARSSNGSSSGSQSGGDNGKPAEPAVSPEADSRSKRRNGRSRKTDSPVEKIVVEMTPDQQRIYAEMGISPLVLSGQTPKDPKTATVAVVLPGEAGLPVELAPDNREDSLEDAAENTADETQLGANPAEVGSQPDVAEGEPAPTDADADDDGAAPRRRRRRRSSAAS